MALPFAVQVPANPAAPPGQDVLVEFRAGRMTLEGTRVRPDTRKGLIRVFRSEDTLVHFAWLDRSTNTPEEDLIIFPDEAVFEKVPQANSRVFILKFKHDDRKLFFWMQDPKADEDQARCEAVNQAINNSMAWTDSQEGQEEVPQQSESEVSQPGDEAEAMDSAGSGPVTTSPPGQPRGAVQLSDLQNILSGLGQLPVPPGSGGGAQSSQQCAQLQDPGPSLADILRPERIIPLLQNASVRERLAPHLPEALRSPEAMGDLIQSPQFQQQLDTFTAALRSGQLDLSQFGINASNYGFSVNAFLQAIEDQANAEGASTGGAETGNEGQAKSTDKGSGGDKKDNGGGSAAS